jgi:hypothetical protein
MIEAPTLATPLRRRGSKRFLFLWLVLTGCSHQSAPTAFEPIVSPAPPASPLGAVESLAACWNRLELARYGSLLTDDFTFISAAADTTGPVVPIDYAAEMLVAYHMWSSGLPETPPAQSIAFVLRDPVVQEDGAAVAHRSRRVTCDVDVEVRTPRTLHRVLARCRFVLVRGDSAARGGEPPSPADSTAWFVAGWEEAGRFTGPRGPDALRTLPGTTPTLYRLKRLYLTPLARIP